MNQQEDIQGDFVTSMSEYEGQSERDDPMEDDEEHTNHEIPSTLGVENDFYQMDGLKLAVLINMRMFKEISNKDYSRNGSEKDMDYLNEVFTHLGFEVELYEDNHKDDLMRALDKIAKRDFTRYDCLVVVMMSHGGDDFLLSVDWKKFTLSEVQEKFIPDKCPTLTGKPKLFFIQACRGKDIIESYMARDEKKEKEKSVTVYRIPKISDLLQFFSTEKGYKSAREEGTWFIQCLAKRLYEMGYNETLINILTFVIDDVARKKEGMIDDKVIKQQPVLISTLRKFIKFQKN